MIDPIPFVELAGKYAGGEVSLSWKYPSGAPESVYVLPVYGHGLARRVNVNEMTERNLRNASSGYRFAYKVRSTYDVTRCEFLAFLCSSGVSTPNTSALLKNPAFSVSVSVGRAHVYYWVDSKRIESGFERHSIAVESSYSIEKGILGYSFSTGLQAFNVPFPEAIKKGKIFFPSFFTKTGSYVRVGLVDGANAEVTSEVKRIYKLPSIFR